MRFRAVACAFNISPFFIGKSPLDMVATPLGFEPRITPPKGAVLPLHYGVSQMKTLDWPFWSKPQLPKWRRKLAFESRITPKAFGAVLPLHYGVSQMKTLDWPFWIKPQLAKCRRKLAFAVLDWRFSIQAQCPKFKCDCASAKQLAEKIKVE